MALDPRLSRFLEAALTVGGDLDLETVLRRVVESACALVEARYGALGVISEDRGGLAAFVHHGVDEATVAAIGELPTGRGILGLLIEQPEPLRLEDISRHPASYGFPPHHPPMEAFLGAPIRVRGQVFGNLYLTQKVGGGAFTAEDEDLVVGLAALAGSAIEHARLYADLQRRELWRDAVLEVSTTVMAGASLDEIRHRIAALGAHLVEADTACIVAAHDDGLWVLASTGVDPPLGFLAVEDAPVWTTLRDGEVCHVHDGPIFPGRVALWVPLRQRDELVAALGVVRDQPFTGRDEQLLLGFAEQVTLALTHERAQAELARLRMVEDRERIGRDLHDTVIQRLFATGLGLQAVRRRADDGSEVTERLDRAVDDVDEIVREIRSTIFALQSGEGDAQGVRASVLKVVDEFADILPRSPRVRFDGPIDAVVSPEVADHLVPVVREALTNVAKHADANDVELELAVDQGGVQLRVIDDGRGIDADAPRGFGLANLRERAELLGGEFRLANRGDGVGTTLTWRVPGR